MSAEIRLRAQSCDPAFLEMLHGAGRAAIHSVFHRAVNIQAGGLLYTLAARPGYRAPHTAALTAEADFLTLGLRPGGRAVRRGGSLCLPPLEIDFNNCAVLDCVWRRLPSGDCGPAPGLASFDRVLRERALNRGCLAAYRARYLGGEGSGDLFSIHLERRIGLFLSALRAGVGEGAAARSLVGAGLGLTPAGDDFLCGALAALGGVDIPGALAARERICAELSAPGALRGTTDVSRQMLLLQFDGRAPEPHLRLLECFLREPEGLPAALEALESYGHSSGMDFAAGLAGAFRELLPRYYN